MKFKILAALAALSVAHPASAATIFGTTVQEGQYQTFIIKYSGSDLPAIGIFGSFFVYGGGPGEPKILNYAQNTDKFCQITSFPLSCSNGFVDVAARSWGDVISLYIEFGNASYDHCETQPGSTCAFRLSDAPVQLRNAGFDSDATYEVLSSGGGAVPEPATWAMMILGFGLVGGALRRRAAVAA